MYNLEAKKDLFLLSGKDRTLISEVEQFFQYLPLSHSSYQIKNFIVGQFERCSADRAHRQCLLEIHTRYQSLLQQHYQYRKTELEMETEGVNQREASYKLEHEVGGDQFDRNRLKISAEKAQLEIRIREFGLINIRKMISETLREIRCFRAEMERLEPLCKHPLTERYELCEPEYWQGEYLRRHIMGNRGENLPQIPEADKEHLIESLQSKVKALEGKQ